MSTPHEASLTEKERAILAGLAAQAEAEDPSLAKTLRGSARSSRRAVHLALHLRVPAAVSHWAWGVVLAVIGLVGMVVSLSTSVAVGIVGAVLTVLGIYRAATAHPRRSARGKTTEAASTTSDS